MTVFAVTERRTPKLSGVANRFPLKNSPCHRSCLPAQWQSVSEPRLPENAQTGDGLTGKLKCGGSLKVETGFLLERRTIPRQTGVRRAWMRDRNLSW